jgi:hypothetical protein
MKRRTRNLPIVAVFAPWVIVPFVGAVIGRELATPKSRTDYAIAGAAVGWFGVALLLPPRETA